MSAIQAAILSPANSEIRVARSPSRSAAVAVADHQPQQRRGEMLREVAAVAGGAGGGYSTQMRRNSIDSSLSKVIIISSATIAVRDRHVCLYFVAVPFVECFHS